MARSIALSFHCCERWFILISALIWSVSVTGAGLLADKVPDPLTLEQALVFASGHPRTRLEPGQRQLFSDRQPLYLDCHDYIYAGTRGSEHRLLRERLSLVAPLVTQQLAIMERFFDVLLADVGFELYAESHAVSFARYRRANDRFKLDQFSEIQAAARHSRFREATQQRVAAETAQRLTRSLLGQALARPRQLVENLSPPLLPATLAEPPALETVFNVARVKNAYFSDLLKSLDAAQTELIEMELRQQLLELLLQLQVLQTAKGWTQSEQNWRDLQLELARVLYQQDARADLGDARITHAEMRMHLQKQTYCALMVRAELNALQGKPVWPLAVINEDGKT